MTDKLTLIDEENVEHEFEVEAILDVDEEKYAVLLPMDEEYANSNEAIIMKFGLDGNGDEVLFDIESDEEWEKIADAYDEILEDEDECDDDEEK
ncbi:MAG: DUF1292 domain-containing protein [Clostridiales bacterium]